MTQFLFADTLAIYVIGATIAPILVGAYTFVSGYREGSSLGKRVGMELRGNSPLPISRACPKCGSFRFTKLAGSKDQFLINFDRLCSDCNARFSLPVPRWMSLALIVLGVIFFMAGIALAIYARYRFPEDRIAPFAALVFCVALGFQAILTGVAKLRVAKTTAI